MIAPVAGFLTGLALGFLTYLGVGRLVLAAAEWATESAELIEIAPEEVQS